MWYVHFGKHPYGYSAQFAAVRRISPAQFAGLAPGEEVNCYWTREEAVVALEQRYAEIVRKAEIGLGNAKAELERLRADFKIEPKP